MLTRTSSPKTMTLESRRISSRSASLSASRYRISRIAVSLETTSRKAGIRDRVHAVQGLLRLREPALAGEGHRLIQQRLNLCVHRSRVADPLLTEPGRVGHHRVALAPARDLFIAPVLDAAGLLGREVTDEAVGPGFEERWARARSGTLHCFAGGRVDGQDVHPVHRRPRHPVGSGSIRPALDPRPPPDGGAGG